MSLVNLLDQLFAVKCMCVNNFGATVTAADDRDAAMVVSENDKQPGHCHNAVQFKIRKMSTYLYTAAMSESKRELGFEIKNVKLKSQRPECRQRIRR